LPRSGTVERSSDGHEDTDAAMNSRLAFVLFAMGVVSLLVLVALLPEHGEGLTPRWR
jgi:hypothetical protein